MASIADCTLLIKTIMRPLKLARLLASVRERYPELRIVVCDDGPEDMWLPESQEALYGDLCYIRYQYDVGIGRCYNDALRNAIDTPYAIICDDDNRFTEATDIELWLPYLDHGIYDLVGGAVRRTRGGSLQLYVGDFDWTTQYHNGWEMRMRAIEIRGLEQPIAAQYVMNWFCARREVLVDNPWDEELKVCRHEDWFLSLYWQPPGPEEPKTKPPRVGYHPGVELNHDRDMDPPDLPAYLDLRSGRFQEHLRKMEAKWGLRRNGLVVP